MQKNWIILFLFSVSLAGCMSTEKQAQTNSPQLLIKQQNNFYVYDYMDRHYVLGSQESSEQFANHHHLPYTKTLLGAGPHGETVVFEVAKKDQTLTDRLLDAYQGTPFLVESKGDDYAVFKYLCRLYVVGQPASKESFVKHHHLPYTKTLLGAGPSGETVVFEVDKKRPQLVERLIEQFKG